MKVLDYALIFIVILLPVILVINVNISTKIKSQNMEVYYKNLIDSAISDASLEMKEVENSDAEVDYGYSGDGEKKVSINAEHAVNTFLNSLEYNFNIKGNQAASLTLKQYIPAIAVIDYNGVHIYSAEKIRNESGELVYEHILKPKKYFTYSYKLKVVPGNPVETRYTIVPATTPTGGGVEARIRTVNFTLNNYITYIEDQPGDEQGKTLRRFMQDDEMKVALFGSVPAANKDAIYDSLIAQLDEQRKQVIVNTVVDEVSYAINAHNSFASSMGTTYTFNLPAISEDDWYATVQDTGILAFVQGMSAGNRYLNHFSYGLSKLSYTQKYWPTTGSKNVSYFGYATTVPGSTMPYDKLYHKDKSCAIYKQATPEVEPSNFKSRYDAASGGYHPCPVCIYDTLDYYFDTGLNRNQTPTYDEIKDVLAQENIKENYDQNKDINNSGRPFAYVQKGNVVNDRVKIEIFAEDNETRVTKIKLPDGRIVNTTKSAKVLVVNDRSSGKSFLQALKSLPYVQVTDGTDSSIPDVIATKNSYDLVVDIGNYWTVRDSNFLNQCFDRGVSVYTEGNDNNEELTPIKTSQRNNYQWSVQRRMANEVTKVIGNDLNLGTDDSNLITFSSDVKTWYDMTDSGIFSPIIGEIETESGASWLHSQVAENENTRRAAKQIVNRLAKTQYAVFYADHNGRFEFELEDSDGKKKTVVVFVNDL